jgi:hypothetical protein
MGPAQDVTAAQYSSVWPKLESEALRLGDEVATYGDLLLAGATFGLVSRARETTVSSLHALAAHEGVTRDAVIAESVAFRRTRRLESGEDLRNWLRERELTMDDWEGHLRRAIAGRNGLQSSAEAAAPEGFAAVFPVDLACTGAWRRFAAAAERSWAASLLVGESFDVDESTTGPLLAHLLQDVGDVWTLDERRCREGLRSALTRRESLAEAERRFASDAAVATRISDHASDWMHLDFDQLRLVSRAAASEAVACAREDGISPQELARRAGSLLETRSARLDALPAAVAAPLSGAELRKPVGPIPADDGYLLLWLNERRPPTPADASARDEARGELLSEAFERAAGAQVRELGPL